MSGWILYVVLSGTVASQSGQIVATDVIPGFRSQEACEQAAFRIEGSPLVARTFCFPTKVER